MRTALSIAVVLAACGRSAPPAAPIANRPAASTRATSASSLLPGSIGLYVDRVAVTGACATHDLRVRVVADGDDPLFVALLTLERPTTDDHELRTWVWAWSSRLREVQQHYTAIAEDEREPPRRRVEAVARLVQTHELGADQLVAKPVPVSFDADMRRTYCEQIDHTADTMRDQADLTRALCRQLAGKLAITDGWWVAVCAAPTP